MIYESFVPKYCKISIYASFSIVFDVESDVNLWKSWAWFEGSKSRDATVGVVDKIRKTKTKLQRFFPKNATKTCDINTSMIAWFVRFWVFTMYCTKNSTKEAFFGVSTTNLWPDATYQSSTTGLFRNKGWIHHRDQSRHAIVERRHEGLNRLDHLTNKRRRDFRHPKIDTA